MALIVYQNLYALSSQHYLGINQTALGKSIERLSSGLRINHAADDASGMAISEQMRGQISGLKRASMNAQDGISYLQTAEGAMEQSSSILQRMRELAVQASNGIYTTNDRAEIQKEIDQLKAEIDRISTSTEFNTRKLINGDGTALWSADSNLISAIIRSPVAEGNYELTMSVRPGTNQILKTDIMTLNDDAIGAEIVRASANTTNIGTVSDPVTMPPTGTAYITVNVSSGTTVFATASAILSTVYAQNGSSWTVDAATLAVASSTESGFMEIEVVNGGDNLNNVTYRARFISARDGTVGAWQDVPAGANGIPAFNYTQSGFTINGVTADIVMPAGQKIQSGDKILVTISQQSAGVDYAQSGGGTIRMSGGATNTVGPRILYSSAASLTIKDNGDAILDTNAVTVYNVVMDTKTGNIDVGHVTFNFKETTQPVVANTGGVTSVGAMDMAIQGGGEAATMSTKLKDISRFTDADGNNIFEQKQELTIFGNGKSTVVHIEGNDTIATLVQKLNKAIANDLGMGSDDAQANSNLVRYVSVPDPTGWGTIKGTMLIQTAMTGKQGQLSFVGDQALIDAFSMAEVQKATNNETTVTIRDAHTGNLVGTEITGDDRVYTLIDGVEVVLDSRAGVSSTWDATKNTITFSSDPNLANKKLHLHIVDNRTSLQIGANKGQDLDVSIPQLDVLGLGLENTVVVSQELARQAIGDIDRALARVVSARATIGAQVSRLEHTIENLATARENLTAAESRIRDLDVAEESTNFTKYQILVQSGVAMLAQANQLPQVALQLIQG